MNDQQKQTYIEDGGVFCPFCGNGNIQVFDTNEHAGKLYRYVTCHACGKEWTETFTLTDVTEE